jgi:pimeloyl-ACP methyl ester carboxylesterase
MVEAPTAMQSAAASQAAVRHANALAGSAVFTSDYQGEGDERLHFVSAGHGPTIVFLHGFPSFWYCWIRQLEALRGLFRVIAIDAPGAGASARPEWQGAYRVERLAGLVNSFIAGLDGPVLLIGHDWGAALAFALAQSNPAKLAGVVGIAAPPYNLFLRLLAEERDQRERSQYMERLRALDLARIMREGLAPQIAASAYAPLRERGDISADEMSLFAASVGDPEALWGGASWYRENLPSSGQASAAVSWPAGSGPLALRSLLIWGEADQTFIPSTPGRFVVENPGATVLRLPEIGHWCMLQAPDAVSAALARFAATAFAGESSHAI